MKDLIIKDDEEDTFIVAKIRRKRALFRIGVGNSKKLSQIRSHLAQLPLVKNSVHCGQENGGSNTRYQYLGWRKHPLEAGRIGTYAFKSNAPPNIVETINAQIEVVVQSMEKSAHHLINNMEETSRFRDVQKVLNLKSVSTAGDGLSPQFSVGMNYWSGAHVDKDYFFTFFSCLTDNPKYHNKVMYYFCYPE